MQSFLAAFSVLYSANLTYFFRNGNMIMLFMIIFVDKRTKYITCIVLLFGSMSIKEHRLHVDSPDIDFSLVELKKK